MSRSPGISILLACVVFAVGCAGTQGDPDGGGTGGGTALDGGTGGAMATGGGAGGGAGGGGGGAGGGSGGGAGGGSVSPSDGGFFGAARCPSSAFVVCDDFEDGGIASAQWAQDVQTATLAVDTSRAARGNASLHAKLNAGGGNATLRFKQKVPIAGQRHWGRMFVYVPMSAKNTLTDHSNLVNVSGNNSSSSLAVYAAAIGAGVLNTIFYQASGGIDKTSLLDHPNETRTPVPLDRWFCLEWDFNGADKVMQLFLDGALIPTSVMSGYAAPNLADVRIGIQFKVAEAWFDSVVFASTRVGCEP